MNVNILPKAVASTPTYNDKSLYFFCKRVMDVALAMILLVLLSPVMLLVAMLIKLDSPGPVIYVQDRVGTRREVKDGRTIWQTRNFRLYKFRSMQKNSNSSLHRQHVRALIRKGTSKKDGPSRSFKLKNDPRVTRIGKIIRKLSLDELPQLMNVLKGEMSLVGPRPVPPYEVAEYEAWHYQRLNALPGLTGLWQVTGRGTVSFDEMVDLDIQYVENQSLGADIRILLQTIPAVLSRRGAH